MTHKSGIFLLNNMLLHNSNVYPSVPTGYAVHMKEMYLNMEILLKNIIAAAKTGTSVVIWKQFCWSEECSLHTSTVASFVKGTSVLRTSQAVRHKIMSHEAFVNSTKIYFAPWADEGIYICKDFNTLYRYFPKSNWCQYKGRNLSWSTNQTAHLLHAVWRVFSVAGENFMEECCWKL